MSLGGNREDISGGGSGRWWWKAVDLGWLEMMWWNGVLWPMHLAYCSIDEIVFLSRFTNCL